MSHIPVSPDPIGYRREICKAIDALEEARLACGTGKGEDAQKLIVELDQEIHRLRQLENRFPLPELETCPTTEIRKLYEAKIISGRAYNALKREGLEKISDIESWTAEQIAEIPFVSLSEAKIIRRTVHEMHKSATQN